MAIEDAIDQKSIEAADEEVKLTKWASGSERIRIELVKYEESGRGSRIEKAVTKPVAEALILFCKNERFSEAVRVSRGNLEQCIKKIVEGVGSAISDLEVYQRAAAFYFPRAIISFSMNIDVDGLEMPVQSKEVVATMPAVKSKAEELKSVELKPVEQESKRITVDLSEFF